MEGFREEIVWARVAPDMTMAATVPSPIVFPTLYPVASVGAPVGATAPVFWRIRYPSAPLAAVVKVRLMLVVPPATAAKPSTWVVGSSARVKKKLSVVSVVPMMFVA